MYIIILILLFTGCSAETPTYKPEEQITPLHIWMDLPQRDGEYIFTYPFTNPSSYAHIRYETLPMERVFWFSPDSFTIYHMGFPITEPIVNYSTYSDGLTGLGTQLCYIYQGHVGDTLEIIGCGINICDTTLLWRITLKLK